MKPHNKPPFDGESVRRGVVTVGDGRGFVIQVAEHNPILKGWIKRRFVVTASHCLPRLLTDPAGFRHQRTYPALLGPLHGGTPSIMTECLFVDPVADIAVLGEPDYQISDAATDAFEAFVELVDSAEALSVGSIENGIRGWLLSLDDSWITCILRLSSIGGPGLWIAEASAGITDGMSGSPIIGDDGLAIGVVCTSTGTGPGPYREGGPNPGLMFSLPGWLLNHDDHKES